MNGSARFHWARVYTRISFKQKQSNRHLKTIKCIIMSKTKGYNSKILKVSSSVSDMPIWKRVNKN